MANSEDYNLRGLTPEPTGVTITLSCLILSKVILSCNNYLKLVHAIKRQHKTCFRSQPYMLIEIWVRLEHLIAIYDLEKLCIWQKAKSKFKALL